MTANNQYFERNMLINAKKTNTTLESDDWGPKTELANINRFLDSSAATIDQQVVINNTITSLLGNNTSMEVNLQNMNQKLDYQNSRPPGVGSEDLWLPTQLLMQMVKLQEEGNKVQEETGIGALVDTLYDISQNTGLLMPNILRDISDNTGGLKQGLIDNSKNLINLLDDNIDNSKNLIEIKNEIEAGLHDPSWSQPWLETVNEKLFDTSWNQPWLETVNENLFDASWSQPWLETVNTNLTTLNSQITTLLQKDPSFNLVKTATGFTPPSVFVTGNWSVDVSGNQPKKISLFIGVNQQLGGADYINFETSKDGLTWFLRDRFYTAHFNPHPSPACAYFDPKDCRRIVRNYDWCGTYMRLWAFSLTATLVITDCYAQGI